MKCEENQVGGEHAGPVVSVQEKLIHQKHHTALQA